MIGKQERWQEDLFVAGSLDCLIPDDHILKRVDKVLDLSWLREEVRDCYDEGMGRPSIDPEAAVRLMVAGLFQGIVYDRKLMREAQVNLAIRWFAGYRLDEELPDHSSLTRIRQRWGEDRFRRIFEKTVEGCIKADLVGGETIHTDATLIRADVSWKSLTTQHMEEVLAANQPQEDRRGSAGSKMERGGPRNDSKHVEKRSTTNRDASMGKSEAVAAEHVKEVVANQPGQDSYGGAGGKKKRGRPRKHPKCPKKWSTTDPDATMTTSNKKEKLQPCYKQHTTVDDKVGVILDVDLTTGEVNEGTKLLEVIERVEKMTGTKVEHVTADASYAHPTNYQACEERGTDAVIPPVREARNPKKIPLRRFKYDGRHETVRCPGGKTLRRSSRAKNGWVYRARACDCRSCHHQKHCVPPSTKVRTVLIVYDYPALLRARRRWLRRDEETRRLYGRHRWRSEGPHGVGKTQHGLRRAVRRGTGNVAIQTYLTAAVMNLKTLVGAWGLPSWLQERLVALSGIPAVLKSGPGRPFSCHPIIRYLFQSAA